MGYILSELLDRPGMQKVSEKVYALKCMKNCLFEEIQQLFSTSSS